MVIVDYLRKIFAVSPCYSKNIKEEETRVDKVLAFLHSGETGKRIKKEIGLDPEGLESYALSRKDHEIIGNIKKEKIGIVQKGDAIRDKIESIKTEEGQISGHFFIMFDGNQIPYESFFVVLNQLVNEKKSVVFACRSDSPGISQERKDIEDFELFLLEKKYRVKLPDGQCGCWGFRTDDLYKIAVCGSGFEIELDILTSFLDNKILSSFVHIPVESPKVSDFDPIHNIDKMFYLADKLRLTKDFVLNAMEEFETTTGRKLDEEYKEGVIQLTFPEMEKDVDRITPVFPGYVLSAECNVRCNKKDCEFGDKIGVSSDSDYY